MTEFTMSMYRNKEDLYKSLSYLTPKKWYVYYWEDHTIAVDTGDIIGLPSYLSGGYSWRAKAVDEGVDPNDGVSVNPNGDES